MHVAINSIEPRQRIFCNRTLNMKTIKAVGFDMDYTLALYNPSTFEALAYEETLKKLVSFGYPDLILKWRFNWNHMIRGLAIDKQRGNVIKMDRHRFVKVAYHGFKELTREERRRHYDLARILTYEEPDFSLVDTLFTLADAYLFMQLVELKDQGLAPSEKTYADLYRDVRYGIDLCHRDGSIKSKVAENPGHYIERDARLFPTLQRLRESGRKLFVVTNSLWNYTNVVMNYLFGNDTRELTLDWTQLFDCVITGAAKPAFFVSPQPLYEVDPASGYLKNTDGLVATGTLFQGGNFRQLHDMMGIQTGSEVLYVGDHIYGDILRSKKELGWRTMLVIHELEHELDMLQTNAEEYNRYEELVELKEELDDELQRMAVRLESERTPEMEETYARLLEQRTSTRESLRKALREYHQKFHPIWGELMKTGHQNSRFAAQVENYACLYTSRLTNMFNYSSNKSFRSTRDYMPHDIF